MAETVFIHGLQKTSTSPMVGMLNSHPDICILYETNLYETRISKYGKQLLKGLPTARRYFFSTDDTGKPYQLLKAHISKETGEEFRYFGDKLLSFDARLSQPEKNKVIYMMRDVRSWLVKELIRDLYRTDIDCVIPAIEYLKYIIHAKTNKHALCIRLEDLISDHSGVVEKISAFLDVKIDPEKWLEQSADQSRRGVKSFQKWQGAHPTSTVPFKKQDITVQLEKHPFWDAYLPLFDKYYQLEDSAAVSAEERASDLSMLESLSEYSCTSLDQLYRDIKSVKLASVSTKKRLKSKLKKLVSKLKAV